MIELPIKLLAAVSRFSCRDENRAHIAGVRVEGNELIATDGHRMVRVDMRVGPFEGRTELPCAPFLIPRIAIDALAAAAQSSGGRRVRMSYAEALVSCDVLNAASYSVFTFGCKSPLLDYPPIDQVMVRSRDGDGPTKQIFNPRFFDDVSAVVAALGEGDRGVEITGWGDSKSPIQIEVLGARFVLMPMRAA